MKIEKVKKIKAELPDRKDMLYRHNKFKTSIKSGLVLKKVHRVIKFNQ